MRITDWIPFGAPARRSKRHANSNAAPLYRLMLRCADTEQPRIADTLRRALNDDGLQLRRLSHSALVGRPLVCMVAVVQCTPPARAALVRLVTRLGLDPQVRSVCWESVPRPELERGLH